jgi:hypothetical protein
MVHYFKLVGHSRFYAYYNGRTIELGIAHESCSVRLLNYKLIDTENYDPEYYQPIGADAFRAALDRVNVNILPELKTISDLTK